MKNPEDKKCAKCDDGFLCNKADIQRCQCNAVKISAETAGFLKETLFDCLCEKCLREIDLKVGEAASRQFPLRNGDFVEGLHYYVEGRNWVFTETYHILRGYCCQSGCRHCAYGFQKQVAEG